MMKIPVHLAEKLLLLQQGETLPASSAKHPIIGEMVAEHVIQQTGRIQKKLFVVNKTALTTYLQNKFGVGNLQQYIEILGQEHLLRNELTEISGNSKLKKLRTFKGFLVNCYEPIQTEINGKPFLLNPTTGTFQFIYDFEEFDVPQDITIVGIENPENYRYIDKQKCLFENIKPLFVSRYPQNQSKDLIKWLQSISNNYLHFGDFDIAGIGIYLNEYKKYLGERSKFFVPKNMDKIVEKYGNRELYDHQKINFDVKKIVENNLNELLKLIHMYKKGVEQEALIAKM